MFIRQSHHSDVNNMNSLLQILVIYGRILLVQKSIHLQGRSTKVFSTYLLKLTGTTQTLPIVHPGAWFAQSKTDKKDNYILNIVYILFFQCRIHV